MALEHKRMIYCLINYLSRPYKRFWNMVMKETATRLGKINCDRFTNVNKGPTNFCFQKAPSGAASSPAPLIVVSIWLVSSVAHSLVGHGGHGIEHSHALSFWQT